MAPKMPEYLILLAFSHHERRLEDDKNNQLNQKRLCVLTHILSVICFAFLLERVLVYIRTEQTHARARARTHTHMCAGAETDIVRERERERM